MWYNLTILLSCVTQKKFIPIDGSDDWDEFDQLISGSMKTVFYSPSMAGTFDINANTTAEQPGPTQRQRQQRPRENMIEEKRPQALTQPHQKQKGSQKLASILQQIIDVSLA